MAGTQSITLTIPGTAFLGTTVGTTVNPAAASHFSFAAPADVSATIAFSATITAFDPYGNTATGYTGTVQFTSTDPKAGLPAPYTFTTGSGGDNGVHTFVNGLTLNTAGSQTIRATDKATSSITGSTTMTVVKLFLAPVSYPVGSNPDAMVVGDFKNDGIADLVVTNYTSGNVSVLLGKGDGTFQPAQNYVVGAGPVSVAVGDFNGDGKLDIVTANANGTVSVLLGKGDGTFQTALNYVLPAEAGLTQSPVSLAVGDFNKDGKLDVVVSANTTYSNYYGSSSTSYINVLIGNGAGGFSADNIIQVSNSYTYSIWIAVGDFNGDGNLDLAVIESEALGVLLGNGDGTFGNPTFYPGGGGPIAVGDFNGDGKLDLVTTSPSGFVDVYLGNGNGTFAPSVDYSTGALTNPGSVAVADFNHDGKLDIVTTNGYPSVSVLLGNGDGTFGTALNYPSGGLNPFWVAVGDFNGDGWPDLAVVNEVSNTVSVLLNPAAGSAAQASGFAVNGFPSSVTAGTAGNFTVTAKEPDGTTDINYTGTVHFTSSDPQALLPADYTFTAADGGVHTFSATLKSAGTQSIAVTDTTTAINGTDAGIAVNPAAASTLSLTGFPSLITAGVAGSFTVTARDPYGNVATAYTGTVHFTSSDSKASLPANYTFTASDAGMHTFSASLKTAGTQSITATDPTTPSLMGTDVDITVKPAVASRFLISAPSSVTAGATFSLTVTVEDAYGNVVTGYTGTIHFSSTDSTATLPKNYTFTAADKGVHTFTGLVLRKKGYQKITITDTLNSSLTTSVIVDVL
jgi:hypothetical protein